MKLVKINWGSHEEKEVVNNNDYCLVEGGEAGVTVGRTYVVKEHYYDADHLLSPHYYLIDNDEGNEVIVEASAFEPIY